MEYSSIESFERCVRMQGKLPDYMQIDGLLFTMTHYDKRGEIVVYNSNKGHTLEVRTHDRYHTMQDAKVELYESYII